MIFDWKKISKFQQLISKKETKERQLGGGKTIEIIDQIPIKKRGEAINKTEMFATEEASNYK